MFNIGGQGQYIVGTTLAVWVGASFLGMNPFLHVLLCLVVGTLGGAAWAGIAGILKATVGAHEVISTIMLNWIAIWVGAYLFGQGGPLQGRRRSPSRSRTTSPTGAKLPVFWGLALLQGLSIGIFIALAMLVVYWIIINRTTLGYEVRSVGFNPEAARYGGISVSRNYFLAMAIAGAFAGLAGAVDITGWEYRIGENDIHASQIGFIGLAAALLGRNTAVGVGFASLLFGALINGTSGRQLDPSIFRPELAGNLTTIIQGLVILFVGLNLGGALAWFAAPEALVTALVARVGGIRWTHPRTVGIVGIVLGALAFWLALPPLSVAHGRPAGRDRHPRDLRRDLGLVARASAASAAARSPPACSASRSACSRRTRRRRISTRSSSGARSAPRRSATRRRSRSPRSAASTASAAASSTSRSRGCC